MPFINNIVIPKEYKGKIFKLGSSLLVISRDVPRGFKGIINLNIFLVFSEIYKGFFSSMLEYVPVSTVKTASVKYSGSDKRLTSNWLVKIRKILY